jgi:hypothetical protein
MEGSGNGFVNAVTDAEAAIAPPTLRQARLLASARSVAEENLASHGEDVLVGEGFEQRREKIALHPHVAVQQDD